MEMGQQHLPAVLWADSQTYQGADPALGGQHRLEDGVLLLLWSLRETLPTPPLKGRLARATWVNLPVTEAVLAGQP